MRVPVVEQPITRMRVLRTHICVQKVQKKYTHACTKKKYIISAVLYTYARPFFYIPAGFITLMRLHLCGFFYTYAHFFQHACVYAGWRIRVIFARIHVQNSRYTVTHICKNTRMRACHYTHACNSLFWAPISGYWWCVHTTGKDRHQTTSHFEIQKNNVN